MKVATANNHAQNPRQAAIHHANKINRGRMSSARNKGGCPQGFMYVTIVARVCKDRGKKEIEGKSK